MYNDILIETKPDFFGVVETWFDNQSTPLANLSTYSPNYVCLHAPRPTNRRGGGVALFCKKSFQPLIYSSNPFNTFESIVISFKLPSPFLIAIIYRPPSFSIPAFTADFSELLTELSLKSLPMLILGDFNIKMNVTNNYSSSLLETLNLFQLQQYVDIPTNSCGNTIDLIVSSTPITNLSSSDPTSIISDHLLLNFNLQLPTIQKIINHITVSSRPFSQINQTLLISDILKALPPLSTLSECPNIITNKLLTVLDEITNKHAPLKTYSVTPHMNNKYYNQDCKTSVRIKRQWERKKKKAIKSNSIILPYYKSKVNSAMKDYLKVLNHSRKSFTSTITKQDSKLLFKEIKSLYLPKNVQPETTLSCEDFSQYFQDKIIKIRSSIQTNTDPFPFNFSPKNPPLTLSMFSPTDESEVSSIIKASKKTNCPSETFPSKFYVDFLPQLLPYIVKLINSSFSSGIFPSDFKHATVRPLLKKPNADPNSPSNYRPISLLPFLSKVTERIAANRLLEHMNTINLNDTYQSGYKKYHSTETSLLYLTDQLRRSADSGNVSILINLDLSSAFDTVDPNILLDNLHRYLGISDTALHWFKSYLSERTQTIKIDNNISSPKLIKFGVPQGAVDAPHLFRIYLIPLLLLLEELGLKCSIFADDSGIYISCTPQNFPNMIEKITTFYEIIADFLARKFLKLNDSKTQVILIGSETNVAKCKSLVPNLKLGDTIISFSQFITTLGVEFDESLSFKKHISSISNNLMFHLRNLHKIRSYFTKSSFETVIHAFITSRLDYCNSLYSGLPATTLRPLQIAQNFAARILLKRGKFSHITPVLKELHWLPIESRIKFKIMLFTYKSLNDLAPSYLTSLLPLQQQSRSLRSSNSKSLSIPRTFKVKMGDRAFSVTAPKLWKCLDSKIKDSPTLNVFKNKLKTYLFNQYFEPN